MASPIPEKARREAHEQDLEHLSKALGDGWTEMQLGEFLVLLALAALAALIVFGGLHLAIPH